MGVAAQGRVALQVISVLDMADEWWETREKWSVGNWLTWACRGHIETAEDSDRSHREPIVGYHLGVSGGKRGVSE